MIFSTLKLDEKTPIYTQLIDHVYEGIEDGILPKDSKLPSTREVSKVLGISRNVVVSAYEELESQGIIKSIKGKGTFIAISKSCKGPYEEKIDWEARLNAYGKCCNEMDLMKTQPRYEKDMISFKSITPDEHFFDLEEFKRAFQEVIALEGEKILNYGYARGYNQLIDYLKTYMARKGVISEHQEILITNGFTEGLDLVLSSLIKHGETILCEAPTHHTALKQMRAYGIQVEGVPMDAEGIIPEALEEAICKYAPQMVFLIPSYHNPTGIVMTGQRRREVYALLTKYNVPLIEDGFNEELLYTSTHISPIAALGGGANHIIYLGSLSKILFPGLRIGWIMADKKLISLLESVKRSRNIHTSFLDQAIFLQYMKSGSFERYVKKIRKYYREKYLYMLEQIKQYIPYEAIWGEGGLHVYIKLAPHINTQELLTRCHKKGVLFMPGELFEIHGDMSNTMRLGFARLSHSEIAEGLRIIGETIGELED